MSAGAEDLKALRWIVAQLKADAQLVALVGTKVFRQVIPDGQDPPAVVVWVQNPDADLNTAAGAERVYATIEFVVEGVASATDFDRLVQMAERIDAVLHKATGSTAYAEVVECVRVAPWSPPDDLVAGGGRVSRAGGSYRVRVQSK